MQEMHKNFNPQTSLFVEGSTSVIKFRPYDQTIQGSSWPFHCSLLQTFLTNCSGYDCEYINDALKESLKSRVSIQICQSKSSRVQRWALTLSAYDYTMQYRPGSKMTNADASVEHQYQIDHPLYQSLEIY